ncbi:MAG: BatD family protein [Treponema sp.]|nr:BatD family protein [Treponema sp.]
MKNILILILFIFGFSLLFAEDKEITEPAVSVSVNPSVLTAGSPFTVSIFIDYPFPDDITVITPPFPASITLERFFKAPRTAGGVTRTLLEYRFSLAGPPNAGNSLRMGSFTLITPLGIAETGDIVINIRATGEETIVTRLVWEGHSRQMAVGERATITLRVNNPNIQLPQPAFFMPEVPRGVILSRLQIPPQEREDGIVLKLTLIPLETGNFNLPSRVLLQGRVRFEIPSLLIRITERIR